MQLSRMQDADLKGKKVALRLDLNVPVVKGEVTDFSRIDRAKDTILYLLNQGCRVSILAHFGRPKAKPDTENSLAFLPPVLSQRWGVPVSFNDPATPCTLLENTRFNAGEEADDATYAVQLASGVDAFVNDAFSVSHRAHASVHAITKLLPSYAGFAMQAELDALNAALGGTPKRPVAAIVGGSKISTKIDVLTNIVGKVDHLFLGGGMANTFLLAKGWNPQKSLVESSMLDVVAKINQAAQQAGCTIHLPVDVVAAESFSNDAPHKNVAVEAMPEGWMALDVGSQTTASWCATLATCHTLLWNGPLGAFEMPNFARATVALAQKAADLTQHGSLVSVAGGGDTLSALAYAGVSDRLSYVSAAGGAFLEWLEGKTLPGVAVLIKG